MEDQQYITLSSNTYDFKKLHQKPLPVEIPLQQVEYNNLLLRILEKIKQDEELKNFDSYFWLIFN